LAGCLDLIEQLNKGGIVWSAVSQGIEIGKDSPWLVFISALRLFGSESKRERVKAGMLVAKRRDLYCANCAIVSPFWASQNPLHRAPADPHLRAVPTFGHTIRGYRTSGQRKGGTPRLSAIHRHGRVPARDRADGCTSHPVGHPHSRDRNSSAGRLGFQSWRSAARSSPTWWVPSTRDPHRVRGAFH
jgi:hypothetical protein